MSVNSQRGQSPVDPEEVTNESLRKMCDSTLHLLTTTVGRLADVRSLCACVPIRANFRAFPKSVSLIFTCLL